jgi:predicted O-methyltransferase YrrM
VHVGQSPLPIADDRSLRMKEQTLRDWRTRLSIGRAKLRTITGLKSEGFFIPYKYADQVTRQVSPYPAIMDLFRERESDFQTFLGEVLSYADAFASFGQDERDPTWGRTMFPPFDGAAAYALVRKVRPARILEIGSGNSTRFLAKALRDGEIACAFTCIDPEPRMPLDQLNVEWNPRILSEKDTEICAAFEPNDILFIDSSHIMLPGLDVDIQFNRIFPKLNPGVIVHVHDIFLPYDYPANLKKWWFSEQNALIGWIVSGFFEVIFPSHYVQRRYADLISDRVGRPFAPLLQRNAGSIWLRRSG